MMTMATMSTTQMDKIPMCLPCYACNTMTKSHGHSHKIPQSLIQEVYFRAQGYKTFFMFNSAKLEIFSANKYENANNSKHFHIY